MSTRAKGWPGRRAAIPAVLLGLYCTWCFAHDVSHQVTQGLATVVQLSYGDGEPFSYELYQLYLDDDSQAIHTGRTDGDGRIAFTWGDARGWRLRAFSADGHGVDVKLEPVTPRADSTNEPAQDAATARAGWPKRAAGIAAGVLLILGLFAVLYAARPKKAPG